MLALLRNQSGAQAIEYVAVCALVVLLLTGIMAVIQDGGGEEIGTAVLEKIKEWFTMWGEKSE